MAFVHQSAADASPAPADLVIAIQGDRLLAQIDAAGAVVLPTCAHLPAAFAAAPTLPLGRLDEQPCWLFEVKDAAAPAPAGWTWQETRALLAALAPEQLHAVHCARQLAWWAQRHQFCGVCGTPTVAHAEERARRCPRCEALFFPSASPAVIVAVTRGDELLLAHNRNFRPGLFSLLAGFVDPGETLEQAAIREVREETGVTIDGLRYLASQPWPFPNSLMIGFHARHAAGELHVDGREILEAGWFRRDALPDLPRSGTVARTLIDAWLRE